MPGFFSIELDEWVIMPNHLHGIVWILDVGKGEATAVDRSVNEHNLTAVASPRRRAIGTKPDSLGAIIQNFKSVSTRKINQSICKGEAFDNPISNNIRTLLSNASPQPVWQRDYFERVIRNERELDAIRAYIIDNPRRWTEDEDYRT